MIFKVLFDPNRSMKLGLIAGFMRESARSPHGLKRLKDTQI